MSTAIISRRFLAAGIFTGLLRTSLGVVFFWSSTWKLYQPYEFLMNVYDYDVLGAEAGVLIASALPWLELALGVALICNVAIPGASLISTSLLVTFLVAQVHALMRGLTISCGCLGGAGEEPIDYQSVFRTSGLLLASIALNSRTVCLMAGGRRAVAPARSTE